MKKQMLSTGIHIPANFTRLSGSLLNEESLLGLSDLLPNFPVFGRFFRGGGERKEFGMFIGVFIFVQLAAFWVDKVGTSDIVRYMLKNKDITLRPDRACYTGMRLGTARHPSSKDSGNE